MPVTDRIPFGALLKRLRLAAGLTQEALAERAGLSAKAVSDLERAPTRLPRLESVALLATALRLTPEERAHFLAAARPPRGTDAHPPGVGMAPADARPTETHQLRMFPGPLSRLIGREQEIAMVGMLLMQQDIRLLTLTGPGGVGKTRLAIHVGASMAAAFDDGAIFVDLSPLRDARLVISTIAQRLDVREADATPLYERLADYLRAKHVLLILDNFEQVLDAGAAVLDLVTACPRLIVLITSREALRLRGEYVYPLAPLALPALAAPPEVLAQSAAVELFLDRALAQGVTLLPDARTVAAVAAICRRLDGLPLAIELAAAWSRLVPPPALLARLEQRLPLPANGPHDLPARQRTIRDTIAWSYDLLDASERMLFRRLCVFVGGFSIDAAEALCATSDLGDMTVLAGIASLIDKSLFVAQVTDHSAWGGDSEPRVAILETIRAFGMELLATAGEAEAWRRRHAAHFLTLAEIAGPHLRGPDQVAWLARLEREHDNLRAALRWAHESADTELGMRLAGALWPLWSARGYLSEGRRWLRETLSGEGAALDRATRTTVLAGAAMLAIEQGAFEEAATYCTQVIALARASGERRDLVAALNAQGLLDRLRDRYKEAMIGHQEALALARACGDRGGEAAALRGLATVLQLSGDTARGSALTEEALSIARELDDRRAIADALGGVLLRAVNAGAYEQIATLGEEVLALYRHLGETGRAAEVLWTLGIAALHQQHYERATVFVEESLALRLERGDEHGAATSQATLGMVALNQGNIPRAHALLEGALLTSRRRDDRWQQAMALTMLGHVALADGDAGRAGRFFVESASLFQAIGNLLYVSWCLEGLAGVASTSGQATGAARLCGARDALGALIGSSVPSAYPAGYDRILQDIRAVLGDEYGAAYEAGQALSLDQAIAEALLMGLGGNDGDQDVGRHA